MKPITESG